MAAKKVKKIQKKAKQTNNLSLKGEKEPKLDPESVVRQI